jgi:hypothetical protein
MILKSRHSTDFLLFYGKPSRGPEVTGAFQESTQRQGFHWGATGSYRSDNVEDERSSLLYCSAAGGFAATGLFVSLRLQSLDEPIDNLGRNSDYGLYRSGQCASFLHF